MAALFDANDVASPGHYKSSQTALLLLDFHSLLVNRIAGSNAPEAVKTAARLRKWAKETGIIVVHGLIDVDDPCVPTSKGHTRMESIGATMKSSGGDKEPAELIDEDVGEKDWHFTRALGYVSALSSPGLVEALRKRGVKSLILCGLSTSGCVLRTAVDACEKEFVATVVKDGCADPDDEVHRVVTEKLILMTGFVCSADELIAGFEAGK